MKKEKYVVLCIDDDPDILTYMRIVLERNNYTIATASTAEEGLQIYNTIHPDAVVVDLMMEEVDAGINFVKSVRLQGNNVPIFMLSSVGDSLAQSLSYTSLGLAGVFQKPLNKRHLLAVLRSKLR